MATTKTTAKGKGRGRPSKKAQASEAVETTPVETAPVVNQNVTPFPSNAVRPSGMIDKNALKAIIEASQAGSFIYTASNVHGPMLEKGLVEVNEALTNEQGWIATRATQKGIEYMNTAVTAAAVSLAAFAVRTDVPVPSVSGRGRTSTTYPFDSMEVGASFFVPATEDRPNPAKSLASTVSSATARYAVPSPDGATKTNKKGETVPVMVETRKFIVRAVQDGAPWGHEGVSGAGVWRVK